MQAGAEARGERPRRTRNDSGPAMLRGFALALPLAALLGAASVAAPGAADDGFFAGYEAFRRGDYAAARAAWAPLARAGDIDAQFNLGALYEGGLGGDADIEQAARWYRRAAARRLAPARVALARLDQAGAAAAGAEEDPIALLEASARSGSSEAQYALGVAYDRGFGITRNHTAAAGWYQRAAEQGLPRAQYNLAVLHDEGLGAARDSRRARRWYLRAAANGEPRAMNNLGYLHEKGLNGPRDYGAAAAWYRRAAGRGLAVAQYNLATLHYLGHGVERDFAAARRWYRAAAEQGDSASQKALGRLYANGLGTARDLVRALIWFSLAADPDAETDRGADAEAAAWRDRVARLLSPQERAAAAVLKAGVAARIAGRNARDEAASLAALPRPADGFGNLAVRAQRLLRALGYYDGAVDGVAGPLTFAAIRQFRRDHAPHLAPGLTRALADSLAAARSAQAAASAGGQPGDGGGAGGAAGGRSS